MKMQKRFKANGNGCPALTFDKSERYWFVESQTGDGDWLVVKAEDGFLVPFDWEGDTTGTSQCSVGLYLNDYCAGATPVEVTAADLPYLEKPEGDWEFRKVEVGDVIKSIYGGSFTFMSDALGVDDSLSGYRWCAPRKTVCETCNQPLPKEMFENI